MFVGDGGLISSSSDLEDSEHSSLGARRLGKSGSPYTILRHCRTDEEVDGGPSAFPGRANVTHSSASVTRRRAVTSR